MAALFQGSGYFVEKNIRETDPTDVLELDIVVTDYGQSPARMILVEAKNGNWHYKDIFKVVGQMRYLEISEGAFFVCKDMEGKPPEKVAQKMKPLGVTFVDLGDFSESDTTFQEAGLGPVPTEISLWRWSHIIERKLVQIPTDLLKGDGPADAAAAVRRYHRLVNDGIFFLPDPRERIVALYEAYQEHPRLSAGCALELRGQPFDPHTDSHSGEVLREATLFGKFPLMQASFFVEHRARLAILKCAIDLLDADPQLPKQLQRRSPGGFKYLVLPQVPSSFRDGLEWMSNQQTYRQYARFWQTLLWGCGGFYLLNQTDTEFGWLSARTGVPVDEIPTALQAFDRFFPVPDSWLTVAGHTHCRIVKMVPLACRGLGANLRKRIHGWNSSGWGGYTDFTSDDLSTWNDYVVEFVS